MEIKLTTKNMAYMAMFAAMQVVLEYCTKFYEMPKGGNCAFSLVAIILCGYLMNWGYSLIVSLVCLGLHFALGLATFYGPLSGNLWLFITNGFNWTYTTYSFIKGG